jgi:uncharacterized membrane protein YccC
MLFDLRGRRRRGIQAVYLALALLLGGGLVLFGIGGDVQGGLFDAFRENSGNVSELTQKRVDDSEAAVRARPRDANAYARLAEARYQLAGQSEGFDQNAADFTQAFQGESREQLVLAERAWDRHLQLARDRPNTNVANTMQTAFAALGKPEKAVRAQEIVLEARGDRAGYGDYSKLAQLAYQANQTRKGDLAAERALDLAPRDQRTELKAALDQVKAQAATAGASNPGATPSPTPAPAPAGG